MNLCFCAVNSQRLLCSQKAGIKCLYYNLITFVFQKALIKHFTSVFYFKISFVNSKKNSNSKGDFVFKTSFEQWYSRFLVYKNKSDSDLVFNGLAFKIKNSLHTKHTFFALNCICMNKSKSKIYVYLLLDLKIDNICRIKPPA